MVRVKHRYFLVEAERTRNIGKDSVDLEPLDATDKNVSDALKGVIKDLHGDHGKASVSSSFKVKYLNAQTRIMLIRAKHGGPDKIVSSSLPFLTKIEKETIVCRLLYTGATMRHCYKFLEKRQKKVFIQMTGNLKRKADCDAANDDYKQLEQCLLKVNKFVPN